ncbi:MAG: ABC transporter ATP-binding protein NatA [Planctomycetes bacterium]|nr:ABC transporter ATP-binding protein NatA [Planctomycetota bacterium]
MNPGAPAVEVNGLVKVFDAGDGAAVRAVDGVSFACAPGEVLGLLGPNGAGKTTTLRILATILRPTAGSASVAGHDVVADPDGVRRALGYVSASTGVYERLTGRETLLYYGRLHGMDEARLAARAEELVRFLEMEGFADRMAGRLSSGQRQKVSLARAIVHDPPVLILDEPTANLDVLVARNVLEFVERSRASGRAVLLSTHLFHEAERLCDRIVVIHRGQVLAAGRRDELLARTGAGNLEDAFFALVRP